MQLLFELTVTAKVLNGGEDTLEVDVVVTLMEGIEGLSVQAELGGVGIQCQVNSSFIEHLHCLVVVPAIIDGVDANGVDSELLELLSCPELV